MHVPMQVFQSCQLSVLQLFMLAAMVRLDSKSRQVYNFEVWGASLSPLSSLIQFQLQGQQHLCMGVAWGSHSLLPHPIHSIYDVQPGVGDRGMEAWGPAILCLGRHQQQGMAQLPAWGFSVTVCA